MNGMNAVPPGLAVLGLPQNVGVPAGYLGGLGGGGGLQAGLTGGLASGGLAGGMASAAGPVAGMGVGLPPGTAALAASRPAPPGTLNPLLGAGLVAQAQYGAVPLCAGALPSC